MEITDYQFNGIPVFIYGLIGLTTAILTYATVASDTFSSPEEEQAAAASASVEEAPPQQQESPQEAQAEQEQQMAENEQANMAQQQEQPQEGQGLSFWNSKKKTRSYTYKSHYKGKHVNAYAKHHNKTKLHSRK